MPIRFNFDIKGVYTLIGVLSVGFLLLFAPLIISGSFLKFLVGVIIVVVVLISIWFGFTRGTYVQIDNPKDKYTTSGFFVSRSIPLSSIVRLSTQSAFLGLFTEIHLTYRDSNGEQLTMGTMNVQSFKKGDFRKFIETLLSANPNIDVPKEL